MDPLTEQFCRCPADRKAAESGYRFNLLRAWYAVRWMESICKLYQGAEIGSRMVFHSYVGEPDWWEREDAPHDLQMDRVLNQGEREFGYIPELNVELPENYAYLQWFLERTQDHLERRASGEQCDTQLDDHLMLYGWETVEPHPRWKRRVRRYRTASFWRSKKNKKSPAISANALYLGCGEGEPGNNVYLCAKDGSQAREIAGDHMVAMYHQSEELQNDCKLNKVEMKITHLKSMSRIRPLSSNNKNNIEAKEGLNGSALIDEAHVVDQDFFDTIEKMGISRAEPLIVTFSTAGKNPDSFGRRQWEYGEQNNESGDNLRHLHISHHAPQDLTDKELFKDPEKYGRMANPAWGHTVDPEEFLQDLNNSKSSPRKMMNFYQYRLNVWQRSAAAFIRPGAWDECERSYEMDDLAGMGTSIGIDLSLVDDLSSAVIACNADQYLIDKLQIPKIEVEGDSVDPFAMLRGVVVWPVTWITEAKLEELSVHKPELLEWVDSGHLRVMDGQTISRDRLKRELIELINHFGAQVLIGDKTYAREVMEFCEQSTGCMAVEFPQQYSSYALPTDHFERLVINGALIHPGNPCFTWQALNCAIKSVANKRKPIKTSDNAKIDAAQSAIMSLKGIEVAGEYGAGSGGSFAVMGF